MTGPHPSTRPDAAGSPSPSGGGPIRVLVADDQALVRGALATLLGLEPDLTVVCQVGTGREAVAQAAGGGIDVALLDIDMPDGDGLWACECIAAGASGTRSLIVTTFGRPGYLSRAMEAGAGGFLAYPETVHPILDDLTGLLEIVRLHRGIRGGQRDGHATLQIEAQFGGPDPAKCHDAVQPGDSEDEDDEHEPRAGFAGCGRHGGSALPGGLIGGRGLLGRVRGVDHLGPPLKSVLDHLGLPLGRVVVELELLRNSRFFDSLRPL